MYEYILDRLPYKSTFRFVDRILSLNMNEVTGEYTLKRDAFFYEDHFEGYPVTPGVILTEIMAQIGLVVPGIYYLLEETGQDQPASLSLLPLLSSVDVSFLKMALPGEKLIVTATKQYFRMGKLKSYIEMTDTTNELVAKGSFSGIIRGYHTNIK